MKVEPIELPCPADERLLDYVDGRLANGEFAALERHLDACASCTAVLAGLAQRSTLGAAGAVPLELRRGSTIDRYVVRGRLGAGSMGVVYDAFDPELDRAVAIKVLNVQARGANASDRTRVLREAQAMARLSHPNIVPVLTVGVLGESIYVVMERVDGTTMRTWLAVQTRPWRTILRAYAAAGRGLAAAHDVGVVHRDFKPDNVLVGNDGRVRVIDFGLARLLEVADEPISIDVSADDERTGARMVIGTPAYMPPEQLVDAAVGAPADQFALAASLWEGLFGTRPFLRDSLASLVSAVERGPAVPRRSRVPARVIGALRRALSARSEDRFATTGAFVDALERAARAPVRRVGVGLAAALVAIGVAMTQARDDSCEADPAPRGATVTEREVLRDAFAHEQRPTTGLAAERELHRRVQAWQDAFASVCAASDRTTDLRAGAMACLEIRRLELDAAFDLLVEGDAEVLAQAADIVARLPSSQPCATLENARLAIVDPVGIAEETRRMRTDLARARTLTDAGRFTDATAFANDVLVRATELDHPAVRAEAELRLGIVESLDGHPDHGERRLESAFFLARELGHDEVVADAAIVLVESTGMTSARVADAAIWLEHAEAALRQWPSHESRAALARMRGRLALRRGDWEPALPHYQEALDIWREHATNDDPRLATALVDMGTVNYSGGRASEALGYYLEGLAARERIFGERHPQSAFARNNVAMARVELEEFDEALEDYELALDVLIDAYGLDSLQVATTLNNIGTLWGKADEPLLAARSFAAAMPAYEQLGPDHPDMSSALLNIGNAWLHAGDSERSIEALERALLIRERFYGVDASQTRTAVAALGLASSRAGAELRAIGLLERALQDPEPPPGYSIAALPVLRAALGSSRLEHGDRPGAERELAIAQELARALPVSVDDVNEAIATLQRALDDSRGTRTSTQTEIVSSSPR